MHFDKDNSDEIEFREFVQMVLYLEIELSDRIGIMLFRLLDRRDCGCISYVEFSDIIDRRLKPNYKRMVRAERMRWSLEGMNISWPERKKAEKVVYIEKPPVIKERIIEKPVYKDRIVEKEVIVEKPSKIVEKIVEVEKIVYIDRPVQVPAPVIRQPSPVEQFPVYEEPEPVVEVPDKDYTHIKMRIEDNCKGVFERDAATIMYEILSGPNKDYYFSVQTKFKGQVWNIYKKMLISDEYEEDARQRLRDKNAPNPTKNKLAMEIHRTFRPTLEKITLDVVDPK